MFIRIIFILYTYAINFFFALLYYISHSYCFNCNISSYCLNESNKSKEKRYFMPIKQLLLCLHCVIMFFITNSLSSSVASICPSTRIVTEILTFSLSDSISLVHYRIVLSFGRLTVLILSFSVALTLLLFARMTMITSGKRTFASLLLSFSLSPPSLLFAPPSSPICKGKYCRIFAVMRPLHM